MKRARRVAAPRAIGTILFALGAWLPFLCQAQQERLEWEALPPIPAELGLAGPYVGVHRDHLVVAGGANFPTPVWDTAKVWHDEIYRLPLSDPAIGWTLAGTLPRPLGYGACVSLPEGIVCLGGNDAERSHAEAFLLQVVEGEIHRDPLPSLPVPLANAAAAWLPPYLYLAGGTSGPGLETAQHALWRLDWSKRGDTNTGAIAWESLPAWPGPPRAYASLVAQSNGEADCLYLLGGRYLEGEETVFLDEVWEFDPRRFGSEPWRKRASLPRPLAAGTAVAIGQSHLFTLSGADGSLFTQADALKDEHPGFPQDAWLYHTITDTWIRGGTLPANQVTTPAVSWKGEVLLASGEVRPRVRTRDVWRIRPVRSDATFPAADWIAIVLYLGAVVGIGVFFARRNRNVDDFFRGGQRVPGWVAGLSIFATLLSSITFIALPARAFATNWVYVVVNAGILLCAPLVVFKILPKYRAIEATTAYEYLEQRFNLGLRLFASACFVLFQIGRMAVVLYLPSLALSAITPLSLETCILVMGLMSILYSTLGGLEAVVWTDALQAVVLLGGALLSFFVMVGALEGGWEELTTTAAASDKLRWAEFDWSAASYTTSAFWVMLLGGLGSSLIPYSSDQAVVQRYVSTPSLRKAASAVWLNAGLSAVATVLFFGLGTALYAFYKARPEALDPTFKTDSIFPLFLSRELPVGVAGIVVAAVFAAAQSTVSTSMNSTATAVATDFFQRLGWKGDAAAGLRLARLLTVIFGVIGTGSALILAWGDIESAWKTFLTLIGFFMGPLCGVFLLGMFTQRGNAPGAACGAAAGVAALLWARYATPMNGLLYAPLGILAAFAVGYLASVAMPRR